VRHPFRVEGGVAAVAVAVALAAVLIAGRRDGDSPARASRTHLTRHVV
jgi:hypothetical protein